MVCILKMSGAEIESWIIADSVKDARRKAEMLDQDELATELRKRETPPLRPGKYRLPTGHIVLVSWP